MSELIDNHQRRKSVLKHLMQQLHEGEAPQAVRTQLARLMGEVPYQTVVEVEQELLAEGLPAGDILKFCDIHTEVLKGNIQAAAPRKVPAGHPVHTFQQENRALQWELDALERLFGELDALPDSADTSPLLNQIRLHVHHLADVDKHYSRKENLLFPYLERHGITGPSKVMWAKDDAARELVQGAIEALSQVEGADASEAKALAGLVLKPAHAALADMIYREEQILFPMSLDALSEDEWYAIWRQSPAIGFCLYDPQEDWRPDHIAGGSDTEADERRIQLPSGSLTPAELQAILNNIPFDLTFVDRDDRVRYFTQGRERIFVRTRAILGRRVQLCHPPDSVHVVQQILDDFKSGRQSRAPFWINLKGRFIHIEYFALRDPDGRYLGTLEVSQDLTEKRSLQGEQRLLQYAGEEKHVH